MSVEADAFSFGRAMMQDVMQALPGIDEAMSYSEVMKFVQDICCFWYFYFHAVESANLHKTNSSCWILVTFCCM